MEDLIVFLIIMDLTLTAQSMKELMLYLMAYLACQMFGDSSNTDRLTV